MTGMQCIAPVSLRTCYSLENVTLASFAKFSNSTIFMLLCTVLLAMGSSKPWQVLCTLQGEQTPSDYPLYRLGSFVKRIEVILTIQILWKGTGRPIRDEAVLKLLNGDFNN